MFVTSTTDTPEAVDAANGIVKPEVEETKTEETDGTTADEQEGLESGDAGEEGDEEEVEEEEPQPQPKKKGGWQRKIERLERTVEEERAARVALEATLAGKQPAGRTEQQPAEQPKPEAKNYTDYDQYLEDLTVWNTNQTVNARIQAHNQALQQQREQEALAAKHETFLERVEAARKATPDFDEVTSKPVPISEAMRDVMLESDKGAELAYWLGKHPEDAARIAALPDLRAAQELGKIEATFQPATPPTKKAPPKASKAPEPITPVGSSSSTKATKDPSKMSFSEYKAWRESGGGR